MFSCAGSSLLHGLFSSCAVQASHCGGFSCCKAWDLGWVGFITCSSQALEHRLNNCGCSTACGIFPDQESNPCILHWQAYSSPLSHQGRPILFIFESLLWNPQNESDYVCWINLLTKNSSNISVSGTYRVLTISCEHIHRINRARDWMNEVRMSDWMNKSGKDWVLSHLDEAAQSRRCTDVRQVRSQCLGSWEKADGLLFFLIHRNLKNNKDLNKVWNPKSDLDLNSGSTTYYEPCDLRQIPLFLYLRVSSCSQL